MLNEINKGLYKQTSRTCYSRDVCYLHTIGEWKSSRKDVEVISATEERERWLKQRSYKPTTRLSLNINENEK